MDGFALCSALTLDASPSDPVIFEIKGTIAAGATMSPRQSGLPQADPVHRCVEIMTGARFADELYPEMDAVVKVEDVQHVRFDPAQQEDNRYVSATVEDAQFIRITMPARSRQHRRPAGSDFRAGDVAIYAGDTISPAHVMALASLGFGSIEVLPEVCRSRRRTVSSTFAQPRVGILTTGSELFDATACATAEDHSMKSNDMLDSLSNQIPNSNGPYLQSAIKAWNVAAHVTNLGIVRDKRIVLSRTLSRAIHSGSYDVLISTGGVSMGRFDLVREVLEQDLDADIVFHGVSVRPGLPILFATVKTQTYSVAYFGLPGNPLAAAAGLQFFVRPYLQMLSSSDCSSPLRMSAFFESPEDRGKDSKPEICRRKPTRLNVFWLGRRHSLPVDANLSINSRSSVEILSNQSSYKVQNILKADCWISVPAGTESIQESDEVDVFSVF